MTFTANEVTALCPVTGQPDLYTVSITLNWQSRYMSKSPVTIESKSLKLYLQQFRNEGIFAEAFAARICDDIVKAIVDKDISAKADLLMWVKVNQTPRGGIALEATAQYLPVQDYGQTTWVRGSA